MVQPQADEELEGTAVGGRSIVVARRWTPVVACLPVEWREEQGQLFQKSCAVCAWGGVCQGETPSQPAMYGSGADTGSRGRVALCKLVLSLGVVLESSRWICRWGTWENQTKGVMTRTVPVTKAEGNKTWSRSRACV